MSPRNRNIVLTIICVILVFDSLIKVPFVSSDKKVKLLLKSVAAIAGKKLYDTIKDFKEKEKYVPIPVPILPLIALALKVKELKKSEFYLVKAIDKPTHYVTVDRKTNEYLRLNAEH